MVKPDSANLLMNSDFSIGVGFPDFWWSYQSVGEASFEWVNRDYMKIVSPTQSNSIAIFQTINGTSIAGKVLRVTGNIKTTIINTGLDGGVDFLIQCYDNAEGYICGFDTVRVTQTQDWTVMGGAFTMPTNAVKLKIGCSFKNAVGDVSFDNIEAIIISIIG